VESELEDEMEIFRMGFVVFVDDSQLVQAFGQFRCWENFPRGPRSQPPALACDNHVPTPLTASQTESISNQTSAGSMYEVVFCAV
jgi:hypothetical protein